MGAQCEEGTNIMKDILFVGSAVKYVALHPEVQASHVQSGTRIMTGTMWHICGTSR